jgi:hypothetical protein
MKRQAEDGTPARPAPWATEGAEASALLDLARSSEPRAPESEEMSAEWFAASVRQHTDTRSRRWGWAALGGYRYGLAFAGALLVALALFDAGRLLQGGEALSYRVKSGAAAGQLVEAKQEPIELDFSDGTVVSVESGSKARVSETTRRGARFHLDSGRMAFNVVPHADRGNWLVDAGPFQVRVTGTIFTVEWLAAEGSLRVDVTRGHVVVEGEGERRELGPGDSFNHREATPSASDAARKRGTEEQLPRAQQDDPAVLPAPAAPARGADKASAWSLLVAAGDFGSVIDAAHKRGIQSCLDGCSQEDLRALADAARLGGNASLAERALLAQRSRFAGSGDAAAAAFLLGRSAEQRHDPKALGWYERYLTEAPKGPFAGDALGRKMVLVAAGDRKASAALAEQYLARFPAGPYASHARSMIEAANRGR